MECSFAPFHLFHHPHCRIHITRLAVVFPSFWFQAKQSLIFEVWTIETLCGRSGQPKKNWANASDEETNKKLRRLTWKDIEVGWLTVYDLAKILNIHLKLIQNSWISNHKSNDNITICEVVIKSGRQLFIQADGLPSGTVGVVNTAGQNVLDPLRRWCPWKCLEKIYFYPFYRWSDKLQKELYESRYEWGPKKDNFSFTWSPGLWLTRC